MRMDERIEREPFGPMNFPKSPGKLPWNALVRWRGRCIRRVAARVGAKQHRRRRREGGGERASEAERRGGRGSRSNPGDREIFFVARPAARVSALSPRRFVHSTSAYFRTIFSPPPASPRETARHFLLHRLPPAAPPPSPWYTRPFSSIPLSPRSRRLPRSPLGKRAFARVSAEREATDQRLM